MGQETCLAEVNCNCEKNSRKSSLLSPEEQKLQKTEAESGEPSNFFCHHHYKLGQIDKPQQLTNIKPDDKKKMTYVYHKNDYSLLIRNKGEKGTIFRGNTQF